MRVQGLAEGQVIITGTIPGMTFSAGRPAGPDTWQLAATGLPDTWVGPPQGFVGVVELTAELRHVGDKVVDRQSMRIEWIPASPPTATHTASASLAEDVPSVTEVVARRIRRSVAQIGARNHRKRVARAVTASMLNNEPARPATRQRPWIKPVYRLPTQLTRAFISGW